MKFRLMALSLLFLLSSSWTPPVDASSRSQGPLKYPTPPMTEALDPTLMGFENAKGNWISLIAPAPLQPQPVGEWAQKDLLLDGIPGTSTERAYQDFDLSRGSTIIVAVIDGGMDLNHEDLQGKIWTNEKEANGLPGVDDDGNGYIDDLHGWNFLGNRDGRNLTSTSLSVTREVARLRAKQRQGGLTEEEALHLQAAEADYQAQRAPRDRDYQKALAGYNELLAALEVLRAAGLTQESADAVRAIRPRTPEETTAQANALKYLNNGVTTKKFQIYLNKARQILDTYFNLEFDFSAVIGDDPNRLDDIGYGNPDVSTDAFHATHVGGIIAAVRDNGKGLQGQASAVRLMSLRAVPDGDERDKDVANAIRYAVDNGARIINMSFGKAYSPDADYVEQAIDYATARGVLLVHAAGNDGKDNDEKPSFPRRPRNDSAWLAVGASSRNADVSLPATFSNYGRRTVDLFAPGVDIYSAIPGNKYIREDGTSMAAPETAGVAALVWSQAPSLKAEALRDLLLASVTRFPGLETRRPGEGTPVPFAELSRTGGIVNAWSALNGLGLVPAKLRR